MDKRKPFQESRDSKDSSEDKPRRKLPEPEKVTKKSTPPATMTSTGGLPPPVPLAKTNTPTPHSLESETIEAHSHSHSQSSHHSHTGIPPINQSTASRYVYSYICVLELHSNQILTDVDLLALPCFTYLFPFKMGW